MNSPNPSSSRGNRPNQIVTDQTTQTIPLRRPGQPPKGDAHASVAASSPTPPTATNQNSSASPKSYAEENPDYMGIELPSKFQFYSFKSLSARTLKGSHQAKLNKAHNQSRLKFIVEAMSATLEPGISAFDLTPGDFYFLMYWQKVNSFTKSPQIITSSCTNLEHLEKVRKAELPIESLKIEQFLNSTTLDTGYLDILDLDALRIGLEKYDLGVETMRDVVEVTEYLIDSLEEDTKIADIPDPNSKPKVEPEIDEDEYGWLATRAAFLKPNVSLLERCKIVGEMSAEEINLLERYMQAVTNYGVEEYANINCKECGASKRVKISFDALTFLPNSR